MNIKQREGSRRRLVAGEFFAIELFDGRHLVGRVIRTDARVGPITGMNLVYIYDGTFPSDEVPASSEISRDRLLVPPFIINRLPWSRGYFVSIGHRTLTKVDVLRQHCFLDPMRQRYFDETDNELPRRYEPCGVYAVAGYESADVRIGKAMGLAG